MLLRGFRTKENSASACRKRKVENSFGKKFYYKNLMKNFLKNCFGQCVVRIQDFNFLTYHNFAFVDWRLELSFEEFWINSLWERVRLLTFVYRISIIFSGPTLKNIKYFFKNMSISPSKAYLDQTFILANIDPCMHVHNF